VFVDIDPKTYNINPALIEEKITSKTKAIIPVHLFGQCADMKPILEISQQYDVVVIEDAAQAIGAEYGGLPTLSPVLSPSTSLRINSVEGDAEGGNGNFWKAGAMGHFGCFSFFPSKNLGGFGDGGMVVTNDKFSAQRVKDLRMHGGKDKYQNYMVGINGRLDALQAAILRVKLKYLEGWSEKRRQHAEYYNRAFSQIEQIQIPFTEPGNLHIYNQYVIRVPNRDGLQVYLNEYHIGNAIYYPIPLHLQECFRYLGYSPGDFPESEKAAKETLALPVYPELTQEQQDYVIDVIDDFCGNK
jgi:dTDP-4-amino-4,6-dideoxygalactose transaminase